VSWLLVDAWPDAENRASKKTKENHALTVADVFCFVFSARNLALPLACIAYRVLAYQHMPYLISIFRFLSIHAGLADLTRTGTSAMPFTLAHGGNATAM
jgi:hypothetical protein